MKEEPSQAGIGPSEDDLMAIADAVREVAANHETLQDQGSQSLSNDQASLGRRGHLRAVPS
jgi:hypothetical protein